MEISCFVESRGRTVSYGCKKDGCIRVGRREEVVTLLKTLNHTKSTFFHPISIELEGIIFSCLPFMSIRISSLGAFQWTETEIGTHPCVQVSCGDVRGHGTTTTTRVSSDSTRLVTGPLSEPLLNVLRRRSVASPLVGPAMEYR